MRDEIRPLTGIRFRQAPSWATYGAFLRARAAQLYPAYLVLLALYYGKWTANLAGTNEPYTLHEVIANLLFVQSWDIVTARSIIGNSWSVSVEIIAYPTRLSGLAVDFFFVLSGFVVANA